MEGRKKKKDGGKKRHFREGGLNVALPTESQPNVPKFKSVDKVD